MGKTSRKLARFERLGTRGFPRRWQVDDYSCAAVSTQMVIEYFKGRCPSLETLQKALGTSEEDGTSLSEVQKYLRSRGFQVSSKEGLTLTELGKELVRGVAIVSVDRDHVAVVHDLDDSDVHICDPSLARTFWATQSKSEFRSRWGGSAMIVRHPGGRPTPAILDVRVIECPVTGDSIEVAAEQDEEFECPDCDGWINTDEDCEPDHEDVLKFTCPISDEEGVIWQDEWEDEEELECSACGHLVHIIEASNGDVQVLHDVEY